MEIRLTSGDDYYSQAIEDGDSWNSVFGLEGDDKIYLFNGFVNAGPGDDHIERLINPERPWHQLQISFDSNFSGAKVHLAEGWADDGYGGRDTLVGVRHVHGNWLDDWIHGDDLDNHFWPNGGNDTLIGGGGVDRFDIPQFDPQDGTGRRNVTLEELSIVVSSDGTQATFKPKGGTGFEITTVGMELFSFPTNGIWRSYQISDFITQSAMATQAIMAGDMYRWNAGSAIGSSAQVTYSFVNNAPGTGPGAIGFRRFNESEKGLVRDILSQTAAITGLQFVEVADSGSANGQIRLGVSQQLATKGVSWLPGQAGAGHLSGDIWMDVDSMTGIAPGTEGYQALLHEIGHALGLKHGRNVDPADAWPSELRPMDDITALSVMSQEASSDGLFRLNWGPLDVLALRHLYGAQSINAGDDIHLYNSATITGQTTLMDDGGVDVIDISASALGARLDLRPASLSSFGLTPQSTAAVDNLAIPEDVWIEHAIGTAHDDVIFGNTLDNRIQPGAGNDWVDGGDGIDTVKLDGPLADYRMRFDYKTILIEARDGESGFDTIENVEWLEFDDVTLRTEGLEVRGEVRQGQWLSARLISPFHTRFSEIEYQWRMNDHPITGETAPEFMPDQEHVGSRLSLTVTYLDQEGIENSLLYDAPQAVANANDRPTGHVRIDGLAEVGQTLTVDWAIEDRDGYGSVWFEWRLDGIDVPHHNQSTYTIGRDDVGREITVAVMYWDWGGTLDGLVSAATKVAPRKPNGVTDTTPPSISVVSDKVELKVGQTATVSFTLSEPSTSFTVDDISFSGGQLTSFFGSGTAYTVTFIPTEDFKGNAIISVGSGTFHDAAGNLNHDGAQANNRVVIAIDTREPEPSPADDDLVSTPANDRLHGGAGIDTAHFSGHLAQYTVSRTSATITVSDSVSGRDGTDTLIDMERAQFADMSLNLTIQASAAAIPQPALDRIVELYLGFFGRVPAADGLAYWIERHASGMSMNQIADTFHDIGSSPALRPYTGYWDSQTDQPLSNEAYVAVVYRNVLGREALSGGIAHWADKLKSGLETRGSMVSTLLEAAHAFEGDATWGWVAQLLDDRLEFARAMAVDAGLNYANSAEQAITTGMAIVASVTEVANPAPGLAHIPIKTFDRANAIELIGLDPSSVDLIA